MCVQSEKEREKNMLQNASFAGTKVYRLTTNIYPANYLTDFKLVLHSQTFVF